MQTGTHYRTIELGRGGRLCTICTWRRISDRALEISPDELEHYKNLVAETGALFGSRHYRELSFFVTLSDHVASFGLEHHESSDDRMRRADADRRCDRTAYNADLLPHEFAHSWNGKFRRPAGLATPDYSEPMKGDLLWVYEGLTQYLGEILTPRSGLLSAQDFERTLAPRCRGARPVAGAAVEAARRYGGGGAAAL